MKLHSIYKWLFVPAPLELHCGYIGNATKTMLLLHSRSVGALLQLYSGSTGAFLWSHGRSIGYSSKLHCGFIITSVGTIKASLQLQLVLHWVFISDPLGLRWGLIADPIQLYWGFIPDPLGLYCGFIADSLGLYCSFIAYLLGHHRRSTGASVGLQRRSTGLQRGFKVDSLGLYSRIIGTSVGFYSRFIGAFLKLYSISNGASSQISWGFIVASKQIHLAFNEINIKKPSYLVKSLFKSVTLLLNLYRYHSGLLNSTFPGICAGLWHIPENIMLKTWHSALSRGKSSGLRMPKQITASLSGSGPEGAKQRLEFYCLNPVMEIHINVASWLNLYGAILSMDSIWCANTAVGRWSYTTKRTYGTPLKTHR